MVQPYQKPGFLLVLLHRGLLGCACGRRPTYLFDGKNRVQPLVLRLIYRPHAALPDYAYDTVAFVEQ